MKLNRVLLLIFFSCTILFVGVVSDISAASDSDVPYEAIAEAERFDNNSPILQNGSPINMLVDFPLVHVRLHARALCSSPDGRNGAYSLVYTVPNVNWILMQSHFHKPGHLIHGKFDYDRTILRFYEHNPAFVVAAAYGNTGGTVSGSQPTSRSHSAAIGDGVPAWVPPPPSTIITQPDPDPSDPDSDTDSDGPCQSPGLYPVNGLYTATAGETKESCLVAPDPYYAVALYVKNPGDTSQYGTRVTEINGDCITSTATLSYTFPSNASGDYLITAVVDPCGHGHYEYSYTVSVTLPPGIYPTDTGPAGATPGTPYELKVITDESYYWINWYVKRADEAGLGTKVESNSGGTSTEATMSHTYNVIGDYVITAVIWRGSDMSRYEETYNLRCDS